MPKIPNISYLMKDIDERGFDMIYLFDQNRFAVLIVHTKIDEQINHPMTIQHSYKVEETILLKEKSHI